MCFSTQKHRNRDIFNFAVVVGIYVRNRSNVAIADYDGNKMVSIRLGLGAVLFGVQSKE